MIDIHCHIIYGVDDGAFGLSESVEMARVAHESGTTDMIATPHANAPDLEPNTWGEDLESRLDKINNAIYNANIPVTVHPGQELFCSGDIVKRVKQGEFITLNKSRYILVEFDFYSSIEPILEYCEELVSIGLVPVIAHPERFAAVKEDEQAAYRLKKRGCLLQVNAGSLFGAFGRTSENIAHDLMDAAAADFVASDAHSPYMRSPFIADAHEMISEMYSPDYAEMLLHDNPAMVLADKKIESLY